MNYPTGMGAATGNHYHNVAAQMQAYLSKPPQRQQHYMPMQRSSPVIPTIIPQMASQALQLGAGQLGINPVVVNDVGGFARAFARNLFS